MCEQPRHAAKVPSTCPYLGAIAWHHRIRAGMGLRSRSANTDVMPKGTSWRFLQDLEVSRLSPVTGSAWLALANSCFSNRLIYLFFTLLLPFLALTLKLLFLTLESRVMSAELPLQIEFKGLWSSLTSPAHCSGKLQHKEMLWPALHSSAP